MSRSRSAHSAGLTAADRGELFALTRALSFTRLAYQSLRPRSRPSKPTVLSPITHPAPALTPWDLIEDRDTEGGVAFTAFQQRSEPRVTQSAA